MIETHIVIYSIDIIAMLFLFVLLHGDNFLDSQRKKSFSYGIGITLLVILAEFGTILVSDGDSNLRIFNIIFNVFGFAMSPFIPIILIAIFDSDFIKRYKILFVPSVLNAFITFLSPFFGFIFFVDAANQYERGHLFFVFVIIYMINIILLMMVTWYHGEKRLYPIKWKILALSLFTLIGTCIQLIIPSVYSSWHCITLAIFLLYVMLSDFQSSFDILTKLQNRSAFEKMSKKLNDKSNYSIIIMDINKFKEVNDTYGHDCGDDVLKEIATVVIRTFDRQCSRYRIGGDEFCVITRNTNKERLEEQLNQMIIELNQIREKILWLPTIAYGYGISNENDNYQKTMKTADRQMYLHKQSQNDKIKQTQ